MYIQSNVERLKRRKKELGWSNMKVAEEANVPLGTVNKIFSGATKYPRNETMHAIIKAMGLGYYDLEDYHARTALIRETGKYQSGKKDKRATLKTYYSLPGELRAELIDGRFYYTSNPSMEHQCLMVELLSVLHTYFNENRGRCRVLANPCDVRLNKDNYTMLHPDIFVVADGGKCICDGFYDGAPEMVIEIVSPENPEHDYERKREKYQHAGVKEYWIVDPVKQRVIVYVFVRDEMPMIYTFDDEVESGIYLDLKADFRKIEEAIGKVAL